MKLLRIEPKSELSNTILQIIRNNSEKAEHITTAAELAGALNQNEFCVVEKSTLEHFRLRSREQERKLEEKLQNILSTLKVPPHIKGFRYLKDAIKYVYDEPKLIDEMLKSLYTKVASINGTQPLKVQRDIRNAVDLTCNVGKIENLNKILKLEDEFFQHGEKFKNNEFISLIANQLRVEFPWDGDW